MHYLKYVWGWAITAALVACGGGGGSPGTTTGSSGAGSTPAAGTPTLVVELVDAAGVKTNFVSGSGVTARATVKDASGAVVAGKLVTFAADATLIKFSPSSGQVLTDANGVASIQMSPASITAGGAGSLNVATTVGTTALTAAFDFQLSASNVALTALDLGTGALAAFGNRAVSVLATINGVAATNTPIQVTFQASCGAVNPATVTTDNTGKASTTYSANNVACAGSNVSVSASAPGAVAVQGTIAVQLPQATNVEFVSATPQLIYLTGSVGATQARLSFRVVDSAGTPLQNQSVQLALVTNTGTGVSLGTVGNSSPITLTSDATGIVSVPVFSGTVPTSVQVRASLVSNSSIFANSNALTVASGRAVQAAASLAVAKFAIEGFNIDGQLTEFTMSLADRQGNPVPDGTQVNFVAEGGVMIPASCVTSGGTSSCAVQVRSQGTRPANGIVAVLAYVPGEEDFVDANFNNIYDSGETFTDLGNAYRDDNDSSAYDSGEFLVPRAGATTCAGGANGRANTCDGVWGPVDVRKQANVIFATSAANITGTLTNTVVGTSTLGSLEVSIADTNGNSMPTGSAITVEVTSAGSTGCAAKLPSAVVPNRYTPFQQTISTEKCRNGDRLTVKVTAPSGLVSFRDFSVP
ncbi:MAG: hypothetical protein AB7P37_19035 [Ramlibacter sp.]